MSISEFLDRWLAHYAKHKVSPKTYERYQEMIDGHIRPAFGSYLLPKPPPLHIHCEPAPAINAVVIHLPDVGVFGNAPGAYVDRQGRVRFVASRSNVDRCSIAFESFRLGPEGDWR